MNKGILHRFLPYQRAWLLDQSDYKIGLWARQTGKDFTCAAEAVLDCMKHRERHWLILACGERQARESLEKAREWTRRILRLVNHNASLSYPKPARESSTEIRFANGSRIIALPAKPGTVRGYSANLILTEFAFHDDPEAIWQAIFPSVSNPLRGGRKKLRIISTPNGKGNLFHQLWLDGKMFRKFGTTIHDAAKAGLNIDLAQLKAGIFSPEAWAQEYECEFLDQSTVLLPYDLIDECESPEATETATIDDLSRCEGELFLGIDFGRKKDLTVCWALERRGSQLWTREVLVLERTSTSAQLEMLRPRVRLARRVCLDYTGAGLGLGDLLADEFGGARQPEDWSGKVELCHFTPALKNDIFVKLRTEFEKRSVWIPHSLEIREDLHAMHRTVSASGHISFHASHRADGHSDRCTALALALRAAANAPGSACASSVGSSFRCSRGW